MQFDSLSPQQARNVAKPRQWTTRTLLEALPEVPPWWIRDAIQSSFSGELSELYTEILAMCDAQSTEQARAYLGLVLFFLGHPLGASEFLLSLQSANDKIRLMALDTLRMLKAGDVTHDQTDGQLHVLIEDIYLAIRDLMHAPDSEAGKMALKYVLNSPAFVLAKPETRSLLTHPNAEVRNDVLCAYLYRGVDEGALDALEKQLLFANTASLPAGDPQDPWWDWCWNNSETLLSCARHSDDIKTQHRAADLALRIMHQSLASEEPEVIENLNYIPLLRTITLTHHKQAVPNLLAIVDAENAPPILGAHVLCCLFDLDKYIHQNSNALVKRMIQVTTPQYGETILEDLASRQLIEFDAIQLASRTPAWSAFATPLLIKLPKHANLFTQNTIAALKRFVAEMDGQSPLPTELLNKLHQLPRTEEDNQIILTLLRSAHDQWQAGEQAWRAPQSWHYLLMFGDTALLNSGRLTSWNLTNAQWRANRWRYADIAEQLVKAGIIASYETTSSKTDLDFSRAYDAKDAESFLSSEFGEQFLTASIQDDGYEYEHHLLFKKLATSIRPPLALEALSQTVDFSFEEINKEGLHISEAGQALKKDAVNISEIPLYSNEGTCCLVRFIYNDQVYNFAAYPEGSWMDVWSVLHAFNLFMQHLGRNERAYWLEDAHDWNSEWQIFFCANHMEFDQLNQGLCLPVRRRAD
ncbi:MAG: hypothetical protein E6Q34_09150 [Burkholderiaceae bacterium]|nr:MAG: hypothetical protein E6Q34_09150 [Burkholderiaceae bacterium]